MISFLEKNLASTNYIKKIFQQKASFFPVKSFLKISSAQLTTPLMALRNNYENLPLKSVEITPWSHS